MVGVRDFDFGPNTLPGRTSVDTRVMWCERISHNYQLVRIKEHPPPHPPTARDYFSVLYNISIVSVRCASLSGGVLSPRARVCVLSNGYLCVCVYRRANQGAGSRGPPSFIYINEIRLVAAEAEAAEAVVKTITRASADGIFPQYA